MSRKREWARFVDQRRCELHDAYPCAMPTQWRRCPKHRNPVPRERHLPDRWTETPEGKRRLLKATTVPLSATCKPCRDELYEQLAAEYTAAHGRQKGDTTMSTTDNFTNAIIEGEVDHVGEIVPYESPAMPSTLFGTSDPELALGRMATMAKLLDDVVRERKLVKKIAGNEYVLAPGWAVLGGMTGLAPFTVWTRKLEDGTGYIARVEVRRVADGVTISAAEQVCSRSEAKWARADDHALLGMAQTRASRRALMGPLQQIIELAGYKSTPAEEMTDTAAVEAELDHGKIPPKRRPTTEQKAQIGQLLVALSEQNPDVDWKEEARRIAGCQGDMLTATGADMLIDRLEQRFRAVASEAAA
jgi:hypothetical protein